MFLEVTNSLNSWLIGTKILNTDRCIPSMALEKTRCIYVHVARDRLEQSVIGLAYAVKDFDREPMRMPTSEEFFRVFNEGTRDFNARQFYVQSRAWDPQRIARNAGRIGVGYTIEPQAVELRFHQIDNGENVSEDLADRICKAARDFFSKQGLPIAKDEVLR